MSAGKKGIAGAELAALLQYVVSSQGPLCEKKLRKYLANYPVFDIREGPDSSYSVKTSEAGFPDALRLPERCHSGRMLHICPSVLRLSRWSS